MGMLLLQTQLVSFFCNQVELTFETYQRLQGSSHNNTCISCKAGKYPQLQPDMLFFPFNSWVYSSRLWKCRPGMFVGGNPDDAGAGFKRRTVWQWYGLRGNIASPRGGVFPSTTDPHGSPRGLLAEKEFPEFPHLQCHKCHVDYTAGWAERRLLITFALRWWLSFTFWLSFRSLSFCFLTHQKQTQPGWGQSSRFRLPIRLNTSVRTCQGKLK